jgi:hypothetical protein
MPGTPARRYAPSLRSQPLTLCSTGLGWNTFQPAQAVHFSTGLDIDIFKASRTTVRKLALLLFSWVM